MPDNPFSGFAEGMNQGVNWAVQKTQLDQHQQQIQQQQQYQDEIKRQFNVKVGSQVLDDMLDAATLPKGPVKDSRLKALEEFSDQSGLNIHPDWIASLKDENFTPKWADVANAVPNFKLQNPEAFGGAMENLRSVLGNKMTSGIFEKMIQGMEMANAAKIRADATVTSAGIHAHATKTGIESRLIRDAQHQYGKAQQAYEFVLNGSARGIDLLEQLKDPNLPPEEKVKSTKQLRTIISGEMARLATQKANFGEGTSEAVAINSYETMLKDVESKVLNKPVDTLSPEFIDQEINTYKNLMKEYMQAHDRTASTLMAGSTNVQQRVIGEKSKAFQRQFGKRFEKYGGWQGQGVEGVNDIQEGGTKNKTAEVSAQSSPQLRAKAMQIFQQYQKMSDGPQKQGALKKMKESFPDDIKRDLGIN